MPLSPQIRIADGHHWVPIYLDPDSESDETQDFLLSAGAVEFVGFDRKFRTVIHYLGPGGPTVLYPAQPVSWVAEILSGGSGAN